MPSPDQPVSEPHRAEGLAGTPAVHQADRWWLVASSGPAAADTSLAHALDRHAADLAAADRAVADAMEAG